MSWDSQASQNLDAIEIYRSTSPIDMTSPGTPIVTLPGSATEYEDFTAKNKSLYYYRLASRKGTDRGWGENQFVGYFSETGPGRNYPIRGDWNAGMMDILSGTNFINAADFFAKLPSLTKFGAVANNIPQWYKMCYKGKVLFVPSVALVTASWNELYSANAIFGEVSTNQLPNGPYASGKLTVEINGLTYIVRLPKISPLAYSNYITTQDQTLGSEWRDTVTRLFVSSLEPQSGAKSRLFDLTGGLWTMLGSHLNSATGCVATLPAAPAALTYGGIGQRYATGLILELVMP